MADSLKQNRDFLSLLLLNKKTEKIQICALLETINSSQLHSICIILSNIIKDDYPLSKLQRKKIKENKRLIKRVLDKKTTNTKKYNIISRNSYKIYSLLILSTPLIKGIINTNVIN